MLTEPTHEHHAEQLVATFLRGMGVAADEADEIAFMPLADVCPVQGPIFSTVPAPRKSVRRRTTPRTPTKRTAARQP